MPKFLPHLHSVGCNPKQAFDYCSVCVVRYISGLALVRSRLGAPSRTGVTPSIALPVSLQFSSQEIDPASAQRQSLGPSAGGCGPDSIDRGGDDWFPRVSNRKRETTTCQGQSMQGGGGAPTLCSSSG